MGLRVVVLACACRLQRGLVMHGIARWVSERAVTHDEKCALEEGGLLIEADCMRTCTPDDDLPEDNFARYG